MARDYYDRPIHKRIGGRIIEGLISMAAVQLLAPSLLQWLAPLQAQLNANALNSGQTPPTQGANAVANTLITKVGT